MIRKSILIVLVGVATTVLAINKKSDDQGGLQGGQPVYSAPGGNGPYSVPNQYNPNANVQEHNGQGPVPQGSPQSNLYYYYYPVQEKPKESPYHSQNAAVSHPSSAGHDGQEHSPMEAAASGSEISYSTQEMNPQDAFNPQSQGFDPQALSNLASQLQGYGFNNPSNGYDGGNSGLGGYVSQADASSHMASQVHPGYSGPLGGPQGLSFAQGTPFAQHAFGNFPGNQQLQPQQSEVSSIASGLKKYGLSSILMPVLALAGLSLLLPTVTSLGTTTTKTKRSIEDSSISSYIEKMDTYYKMYNKALEKEECMNRMICELG